MLLWYVIMDKENFLASNVAVRHPKKKKRPQGFTVHLILRNCTDLKSKKCPQIVYSINYKQLYYSSGLLHSLHIPFILWLAL